MFRKAVSAASTISPLRIGRRNILRSTRDERKLRYLPSGSNVTGTFSLSNRKQTRYESLYVYRYRGSNLEL